MAIGLDAKDVVSLGILLFDVTEDNNATNVLSADVFGRFGSITIGTTEDSLTGTVTVEVLLDPALDETADASWITLQDPAGTDVAIAANKAVTIAPLNALSIRLKSSGTEAADRTFYVTGRKQWQQMT